MNAVNRRGTTHTDFASYVARKFDDVAWADCTTAGPCANCGWTPVCENCEGTGIADVEEGGAVVRTAECSECQD